MIHDNERRDLVVGIRFQDTSVRQGAQIKRAYLQFTAEECHDDPTDLTIHAELSPHAEPFTEAPHDLSSRARTSASVQWSPEPCTVDQERSEKQRTPDLSSLIQEVVDQPDWQEGNAVVFLISGSGNRRVETLESFWIGRLMLYVEH